MVERMGPDERALRNHLDQPAFLEGVGRGRWRVAGQVNWPHLLIAVSAAPRDGSPSEYFLRFDLTGYPATAPTATPWDPVRNAKLADSLRPKGELVAKVFRTDWKEGEALYAPFDRVALGDHPDWVQRYPGQAWHPSRDLAWLLRNLHRLVNDGLYVGV